jgi:hypothetical protein
MFLCSVDFAFQSSGVLWVETVVVLVFCVFFVVEIAMARREGESER